MQCGRPGFEPWVGEGKGYLLQYSGLENSLDCIDHGVTESDMSERLSLCTLGDAAAPPLLLKERTRSLLSHQTPELPLVTITAAAPPDAMISLWLLIPHHPLLFRSAGGAQGCAFANSAPRRPCYRVSLSWGQLQPQGGELLPDRHLAMWQEECPLQFRNRATQALRF